VTDRQTDILIANAALNYVVQQKRCLFVVEILETGWSRESMNFGLEEAELTSNILVTFFYSSLLCIGGGWLTVTLNIRMTFLVITLL